jgi:hypothetical protein
VPRYVIPPRTARTAPPGIRPGSPPHAPDILADFGLKAKKARTPLTVEQKAAVVAKNAATRLARGTKGATQKLGVTGAVTGVVVTPVTAAKPAAAVASGTSTPVGSPAAGATTAPPTHTS